MHSILSESDFKKTWSFLICLSYRKRREKHYSVLGTTSGDLSKWTHHLTPPNCPWRYELCVCYLPLYRKQRDTQRDDVIFSKHYKSIKWHCLLFNSRPSVLLLILSSMLRSLLVPVLTNIVYLDRLSKHVLF